MLGFVRVAALAGLALVGLSALPVVAQPANTSCTGTLTSSSYTNVTVPAGASCNLSAVTVAGTVTVQPNATLNVAGAIIGNLIAQQGTSIDLRCSTVMGSLIDTNGSVFKQDSDCAPAVVGDNEAITGVTDLVSIGPSTIGGSLTVSNNRPSGGIQVTDNLIGTALTVNNNTAPAGIAVRDNTVTNKLTCMGNQPPPTATDNSAPQATGQCAPPVLQCQPSSWSCFLMDNVAYCECPPG